MFTYETTDRKEARRFRIAQFNGRSVTIRSAAATVTGRVRSIVESKTGALAAWVITVVPEERVPTALATRSPLRRHIPAEDYL